MPDNESDKLNHSPFFNVCLLFCSIDLIVLFSLQLCKKDKAVKTKMKKFENFINVLLHII